MGINVLSLHRHISALSTSKLIEAYLDAKDSEREGDLEKKMIEIIHLCMLSFELNLSARDFACFRLWPIFLEEGGAGSQPRKSDGRGLGDDFLEP
jgi:hypothetical protein